MLMFCIFLLVVLNCDVLSSPNNCPPVCNCNQLRRVTSCRSGKLERIPWNLPDPNELLELDMQDNKVQDLMSPIDPFQNLQILDLSYNEVERIGQNIFAALNKLWVLLLRGNRLQRLPSSVFRGLQSLHSLDLSSNRIETIDEDAFSDLVQLEKLNLANNRLSRLKTNTFQNLGNLQHLTLSDNFLYEFPPLEGLLKLNGIYLDVNLIEAVPPGVFKSAPSVQLVSINGNFISNIADDAFETGLGECASIERLFLRNNLLLQVPQKAVRCLKDLLVLDLSGNLMELFTDLDFKGLLRLNTLVLSDMPRLKTIKNGTFSTNLALRELTITSSHQLTSIELGSFGTVSSLRRLDLHGNSLTSLNRGVIDWDGLDFLDLRFNRWVCDCQLRWLHREIETIGANKTRFQLLETKCSFPLHLSSRRIVDLSEADLVCLPTITELQRETEDKILIGILGGTCSVLFVVMIFVVFRFRNSFLNPSSGTYPYAAYIYPSSLHPDIHPNRESQPGRRSFRVMRANQEISRVHESSENLTRESIVPAKEKKSEVRFNLDDAAVSV